MVFFFWLAPACVVALAYVVAPTYCLLFIATFCLLFLARCCSLPLVTPYLLLRTCGCSPLVVLRLLLFLAYCCSLVAIPHSLLLLVCCCSHLFKVPLAPFVVDVPRLPIATPHFCFPKWYSFTPLIFIGSLWSYK